MEYSDLPVSLALPIHPSSSLLINTMFFLSNTHILSVENSNKYISKILMNWLQSFLSMVF